MVGKSWPGGVGGTVMVREVRGPAGGRQVVMHRARRGGGWGGGVGGGGGGVGGVGGVWVGEGRVGWGGGGSWGVEGRGAE